MKKILLIILVCAFLPACASRYTFAIKYETDRRESLLKIAKTATGTYNYATKIYTGGYVKDYDLIIIMVGNNDFEKSQILKDYKYYCESLNGFIASYNPKFKNLSPDYNVCYVSETPIFAISNFTNTDCNTHSGNYSSSAMYNGKPLRCLITIQTEEYFSEKNIK